MEADDIVSKETTVSSLFDKMTFGEKELFFPREDSSFGTWISIEFSV